MKNSDRLHLSRVAALGCLVCKNLGFEDTPAEIHHPRTGQGMSQRAKHQDAIPLCPMHHRTGGFGIAIHAGQKTWEAKHGTELDLLAQVKKLLNIGDDDEQD
jgi:hypothetical protein